MNGSTTFEFASDVDVSLISLIKDGNYAGVQVDTSSVRVYETDYAAHVLGYTGSIQDWDDYKDKDGYTLASTVGISGVESAFEEYLHGNAGKRLVTFDNDSGKITGELYSVEPKPGSTVALTIDIDFQAQVEEALKNTVSSMTKSDGIDRGAAVAVVQVGTGDVLALASYPTYSLSTFRQDLAELSTDPLQPMWNRATQGKYAPGSVFKILTTLEYYRENPSAYDQYAFDCSGSISVDGQTIHCAGNKHHGQETLKSSFSNSCNSSFANISLSLNREKFKQTCDSMLFNQNLPIAFESGKSSFSLNKNDSNAMAMETGIGQGKTLVSPLHMALIASAVDHDGILMRPYLVNNIQNDSGVEVSSNKPKTYATLMTETEAGLLQQYMRAVVTDGTGRKLSGQSYEASGKTGTAQVSDTSDQTNAWFVGYAKKDGYKDIAIAVVVENSGAGSTYAVPVAKNVFDVYFNR